MPGQASPDRLPLQASYPHAADPGPGGMTMKTCALTAIFALGLLTGPLAAEAQQAEKVY